MSSTRSDSHTIRRACNSALAHIANLRMKETLRLLAEKDKPLSRFEKLIGRKPKECVLFWYEQLTVDMIEEGLKATALRLLSLCDLADKTSGRVTITSTDARRIRNFI